MKRIQNKIAESRWSLPILAPIAIALWGAAGIANYHIWINLLCLLLSTYLMVELNNANALIRIYSRMVSSAFVVMATIAMFQMESYRSAIVILCIVGYYTSIFRTYQEPASPGWSFYAFICIGLASIVWVQTLIFLPFLWLTMAINLRALSFRNFCASIFGLVLPYWIYAAFVVSTGDFTVFINHFTDIATFDKPFNYEALSINQIITASFVILCSIIGTFHFLRQQFNDNLRTRMIYQVFIIINSVALAFLLLQPQHYDALLGILIASTSPLIAHFIALTHTRWTNMLFKLLCLLSLALVVYNLWINLLTFLPAMVI